MTEQIPTQQVASKPTVAKRGVLITLLAIAIAVTVGALAVSNTQGLRGSAATVMNFKADAVPATSSKVEKNEIITKVTTSRDDRLATKEASTSTSTTTNAKLAKVQSAVQKTQAEVKKISKMLPVETKDEKKVKINHNH